jgi:4-hydroxybenzoate polyprenyltransferase
MHASQAPAGGATALRALRFQQWRHLALLPAAGIGRDTLGHPSVASVVLGRAALAAGLALAFSYGVNAMHDRATDCSAAKNPLAGAARVTTDTRVVVWTCAALALIAAGSGGVRRPVAYVAASLVAGAVYSAGPRLKAYPFLGTVLNVGIFLPLMWLAGAPICAALPITFVALLLQNQLWHEREDLDEDRVAAVRTTASVLGDGGTRVATTAVGAIGAFGAVAMSAARGSYGVATASVLACVLGAMAPLFAPPTRRRTVHRTVSIVGGALVYAAGLAAP